MDYGKAIEFIFKALHLRQKSTKERRKKRFEDIVHYIGDANTILEPILFIILFLIFLFYLKRNKN